MGEPQAGVSIVGRPKGLLVCRPKGPRAQGGACVEGRGQVRRAAPTVILSQVSGHTPGSPHHRTHGPLAGQALSRDWPGPRPSRGAALP